jgi:hypothetical protein
MDEMDASTSNKGMILVERESLCIQLPGTGVLDPGKGCLGRWIGQMRVKPTTPYRKSRIV